jgi:hypothetical protein
MAIKKIKFCDNKDCGKSINGNYIHFPHYGWTGRDFCSEECLRIWAFSASDFVGGAPEKLPEIPEIQLN